MIKCKICDSYNYTEIGFIKNIWKDNKKIYQCNDCELYFIDSPNNEEIDTFYKNDYHNNIKNKFFLLAKNKMRYARVLSQFNFIKNIIDYKGKKICEIGAFDGLFLSLLKNNHCDVYGYEINDNAREYAKKKYNIDLRVNFFESNDKYDIIILSHVIEHFKEPKGALSIIKSKLNNNGYIYIEVPNSPMIRKNQCSYDMLIRYLTTEHIVNFNMNNLKILMGLNKLNIVECKYSNYNVSIYNESLRGNILEGSIPNIYNFFSFFLFSFKTLFLPNNVFIDYYDNKGLWSYGENIRIIAQLNN